MISTESKVWSRRRAQGAATGLEQARIGMETAMAVSLTPWTCFLHFSEVWAVICVFSWMASGTCSLRLRRVTHKGLSSSSVRARDFEVALPAMLRERQPLILPSPRCEEHLACLRAGRAACSAAFRRWYILMKASLMLTCWMHRRVETCPGWFSTMHRGVGMQKRWHPWWSSLRRSSKVSSKLRRWMSEIWQFRQGCVSRCRRRCGSTLPRGLSRVRSGVPGRRCALWRLSHCEECLCTAALSTERRRLRR
mmetsp:Transcript_30691/g.67230  ORF Transcript_30691/g.67230 Transcript_30691/m.67230 type:complete len:251 (+) Transcript_30691:442-1194(+)